MKSNVVVVVQGPASKEYVKGIKESWAGFPIIFSTWSDVDKSIFTEDDIVIYNEYPASDYPNNWPLQRVSTHNGMLKAKELGYTRAVKWRIDFQTNNAAGLLDLFDKDSLNFYAYMDHQGGYFTDFFLEGDVDDIINLFAIQGAGDFPERILTNRMKELELNQKAHFICKKLTSETNVFWVKRNYWMAINVGRAEYSDKIL